LNNVDEKIELRDVITRKGGIELRQKSLIFVQAF